MSGRATRGGNTDAEARTKRYGPGGKAKARVRGKRGRGASTSTGSGGRADDDGGRADDDDAVGTKKQGHCMSSADSAVAYEVQKSRTNEKAQAAGAPRTDLARIDRCCKGS